MESVAVVATGSQVVLMLWTNPRTVLSVKGLSLEIDNWTWSSSWNAKEIVLFFSSASGHPIKQKEDSVYFSSLS